MQIKMLRKNEAGEIEEFYVSSFEEKQLYDTRRKKYRQLERERGSSRKKESSQVRQKIIRDLRAVVTKIKGESV